jgi:predicted phage-related endonuclease
LKPLQGLPRSSGGELGQLANQNGNPLPAKSTRPPRLHWRLRCPDHLGQDEKALIRLWQEKRGEVGPEDLSGDLIVQIGLATEDLNRAWYERNTGRAITDIQSRVRHPVIAFMAATLDGVVTGTGAVYEAKFMLPWSFSEAAAAEKHMAQLQHNMWVTNARMAALSIITGGGKWVELAVAADPLYQHLLLTAEKKFWHCVRFGDTPRLFGVEPPPPRIEAVRNVSGARRTARSLAEVKEVSISVCSALLMVANPSWASLARSSALPSDEAARRPSVSRKFVRL